MPLCSAPCNLHHFFNSIHFVGAYKVTLLVFSGQPDPVFTVHSKHAKFNDVKAHLEKAESKLDLRPAVASKLGYKGFLVQEKDQHHLIAHREAAHLQHLLLGIGVECNEISPALRDVVMKSIQADEVGTFITKVPPTPSDVGIGKNPGPPLNLGKWNDIPSVTPTNNCYNYGTDTMTCTFAQPGLGTGHKYEEILPNDVLGGAVFDGLKLVDPQPLPHEPVPTPSEAQWLVALVVSSGEFYCI
jgi:hypothetical protein